MSLAEAYKNYGQQKQNLRKKGSSYMWSGAGKAAMSVGTALSKLSKTMATNRASYEQYDKGLEALGFDTVNEEESRLDKFMKGLKRNFTKADSNNMGYGSVIGGETYEYDSKRIRGLGAALGTSSQALQTQAAYKEEYGDRWKNQLISDFGVKMPKAITNSFTPLESPPTPVTPTSSFDRKKEMGFLNTEFSDSDLTNRKERTGGIYRSDLEMMSNEKMLDFRNEYIKTKINDMDENDRIALDQYFKDYGSSIDFNKGDDVAKSTAFSSAENIQKIFNKVGFDVSSDGTKWGKQSQDMYNRIYSAWSQ